MLEIVIPERELFDNRRQEFINVKATKLRLEHSLVSISKWEAKHKKSFVSQKTEDRTWAETVDYIRCMTLDEDIDPNVYYALTAENIDTANKYLNDPMTATVINEKHNGEKGKIITSEQIYSWMISLGIPFECERWNIHRLMTLIRVCGIEAQRVNGGGKKMSLQDIYRQNAALNEARRKASGSKG